MSESCFATHRQGLYSDDVSSGGAGLDATWWDGLLGLNLWESDTGCDSRTCGIGLGWDSVWDNDKLTGPFDEEEWSTCETGS